MPVSKNPQSRSFRTKRQQLAIWLMLGCISSGAGSFGIGRADGLEWTNRSQAKRAAAPSPTQPQSTNDRGLLASHESVQWGQIQVPATENEPESRKTPTIRPTETVHSVIGIRDSFVQGQRKLLGGTSIQLLAPKKSVDPPQAASAVIDARPDNQSEQVEDQETAQSTSTPRMVTRNNASILSYHATWQPSVPSFAPVDGEVVLLGPVGGNHLKETDSGIAALGIPETNHQEGVHISPEGPVKIPNALRSDADATVVGTRQYYPSFIQPRESEVRQPEVRQPEPVIADRAESTPSRPAENVTFGQSDTSRMVGSGLPRTKASTEPETTLAPLEAASTFGPSQSKPPVEEEIQLIAPPRQMTPTSELAELPESSLENLEELLPPEDEEPSQLVEPDLSRTELDRDGSNEGQTESDEDSSEVELPEDLTMELLLEEASEKQANERVESSQEESSKDAAGQREQMRVGSDSADSFTDVDEKSSSLSTTMIKPLNPPPPKEILNVITPQLRNLEASPELRDVHEDVEPLSVPPRKASPVKADPAVDSPTSDSSMAEFSPVDLVPKVSLTQLDATGRVKKHSGAGAVEQLSPSVIRLKSPILQTLRMFHARTERADSRSNWGMMHQIMVYGTDTRIIARNRNYSAIAWMAGNNVCRGSRLMTTSRGQIKVREGTGLQGHQAQFLAVMSLVGVPSDYPLYVGKQRFNIKDLVEVEAAACEEGKELTFTLIGLAHYLDTDTTWVGAGGEQWDFSRLIAAELSQPIVGEACGGTHRLMSFAHALRKRRLEGQPITGQWKRAEDFLDDFVRYTYSLQNRDGSMSTNWFESPENNGDMKRKVQTTGHMVEFLLTHLPDEDLADDRLTRAVTFLNNAMRRIKIDDSAVGYRGHALRSLAMYYRRMYGDAASYPAPGMAKQTRSSHVRRQR